MRLKTPAKYHQHPGLQADLTAYDPNLWLVFLPTTGKDPHGRWAVLWEGPGYVPTHMRLRGLEGCCGKMTRFQIAKMIWDGKGNYLDPSDHRGLIMDAVKLNDSKNVGGVAQRCTDIEEREQKAKEDLRAEHRERNRDLAYQVADTVGTNKTIGGYGKNAMKHSYADRAKGD